MEEEYPFLSVDYLSNKELAYVHELQEYIDKHQSFISLSFFFSELPSWIIGGFHATQAIIRRDYDAYKYAPPNERDVFFPFIDSIRFPSVRSRLLSLMIYGTGPDLDGYCTSLSWSLEPWGESWFMVVRLYTTRDVEEIYVGDHGHPITKFSVSINNILCTVTYNRDKGTEHATIYRMRVEKSKTHDLARIFFNVFPVLLEHMRRNLVRI